MPRPASFHNWRDATWDVDSREEWRLIFLKDNEAMSGLSTHLYYYSIEDELQDAGFSGAGPEEQVPLMMEIARGAGKPLFVGEFGPAPKEKTLEEERRQFEILLDLMVTHEVPLSTLWNFDFEHENQVYFNITGNNHRAYMLGALQEANREIGKCLGVGE